MINIRKHGLPPYSVVMFHGGPGVRGEMEVLARKLSGSRGILEPLETEKTTDAQINVFKDLFDSTAEYPLTLVGYSWGAWLAIIFASRYPESVKKVVLISSGGFRESDGVATKKTRMDRLGEGGRIEAELLMDILKGRKPGNPEEALPRLGSLFSSVDNYNPMKDVSEKIEVIREIHEGLNNEANLLRKTGDLLKIASKVLCPVVAIHGDYDPHPAEGVRDRLSPVIQDFRFILLEKCGHKPWIEKEAGNKFLDILGSEISIL